MATLAVLKRLSECPVIQYPGDQLWPSLDKYDSWRAADTRDNHQKIWTYLWSVIKSIIFPLVMRRAVCGHSTADGQAQHLVSFSITGEALSQDIRNMAQAVPEAPEENANKTKTSSAKVDRTKAPEESSGVAQDESPAIHVPVKLTPHSGQSPSLQIRVATKSMNTLLAMR